MATYISILRGINVGGNRKILMADLKAMYGKLGFSNVVSYIQSGNVVFDSDKKENPKALGKKITDAIKNTFGFDVPVIIRTAKEMKKSIEANTFLKETAGTVRQAVQDIDIKRLYLVFLDETPTKENIEATEAITFPPDKYAIIGKDVFICFDTKASNSKLTNNFFEKKLKVPATTRNWRTTVKLLDMAKSNP